MAGFNIAGFIHGFAKSRVATIEEEEKAAAETARMENLERIKAIYDEKSDIRKEGIDTRLAGVKAGFDAQSDARKAASERELAIVRGDYDIKKENISSGATIEAARIKESIAAASATSQDKRWEARDQANYERELLRVYGQLTKQEQADYAAGMRNDTTVGGRVQSATIGAKGRVAAAEVMGKNTGGAVSAAQQKAIMELYMYRIRTTEPPEGQTQTQFEGDSYKWAAETVLGSSTNLGGATRPGAADSSTHVTLPPKPDVAPGAEVPATIMGLRSLAAKGDPDQRATIIAKNAVSVVDKAVALGQPFSDELLVNAIATGENAYEIQLANGAARPAARGAVVDLPGAPPKTRPSAADDLKALQEYGRGLTPEEQSQAISDFNTMGFVINKKTGVRYINPKFKK